VLHVKRKRNFTDLIKSDLSYIKLIQSGEYLTKYKAVSVHAVLCLWHGVSNCDTAKILVKRAGAV